MFRDDLILLGTGMIVGLIAGFLIARAQKRKRFPADLWSGGTDRMSTDPKPPQEPPAPPHPPDPKPPQEPPKR